MATLQQIADETGFSIATVSRVINHDQNFSVSNETRHAILSVAEKLNYSGSKGRLPQLLKKNDGKKKLTIGLVYWYTVEDEIIDPYYLSIRLAIKAYCDAHDIFLQLFYLPDSSTEQIQSASLDGLIALGKYSRKEIEALHQLNAHFVLVDCYTKHPEVDVVMVDLKEATKDIIKYLNDKDIFDIGFIGGMEQTLDDLILVDVRLKTFLRYPLADEQAVYQGAFSAEAGFTLMNDIIESGTLKPAYIVASDAMAIGCLKALSAHQIPLPNKVSIISYNNISMAAYTVPSLTTVDLNTHHLGQTAAQTLHERITSNRRLGRKIFIPTQLIIRESSV